MNTMALYTSRIAALIAAIFIGFALAHVVTGQLFAAGVFACVAVLWAAMFVALQRGYDKFLSRTRDDQ